MLLDRIREALAQLTPAERRVAELVLDKPNVTITWTVTDAARFAGVSEPSVIRLCRRVGCDGFPAFKLELARALAEQRVTDRAPLVADDPLANVANAVFERSQACLSEARADLDLASVERAVAAIADARRLEIYGFGVSGFMAADAQHRFASLAIHAVAYADPYLQSSSAPLLRPTDAVLAISLSGRTGFLVEAVGLARNAGAKVIAIAPAGSPVALAADIPLHVNVHREERAFAPLSARLAVLAVLDVVSVAVAARLARRDGAAASRQSVVAPRRRRTGGKRRPLAAHSD